MISFRLCTRLCRQHLCHLRGACLNHPAHFSRVPHFSFHLRCLQLSTLWFHTWMCFWKLLPNPSTCLCDTRTVCFSFLSLVGVCQLAWRLLEWLLLKWFLKDLCPITHDAWRCEVLPHGIMAKSVLSLLYCFEKNSSTTHPDMCPLDKHSSWDWMRRFQPEVSSWVKPVLFRGAWVA